VQWRPPAIDSGQARACHWCGLHPRRDRHRPDRAALAYEIGDHPVLFTLLDRFDREREELALAQGHTRSITSRSAATDLAWRPRARDEATRSGRLPRLVRLGLCCACGRRRGRLGRSSSRFCCGFGPCRGRLCVVLLETAMFVFAARAAMTRLVAPRSCTGGSSH